VCKAGYRIIPIVTHLDLDSPQMCSFLAAADMSVGIV
jgi:hypothetical protein